MSQFVYRVHALQRMFERSVVESVIQSGATIESYPEDTPYPSRLVLGWDRDRPGMLWSRIIRKVRRPLSYRISAGSDAMGCKFFKEAIMTCVICKSGTPEAGKTTVTLE